MNIFEGSRDYSTGDILIHYDGMFSEKTLLEWIYRNYSSAKWGRVIEHDRPTVDGPFEWNCGRIVWGFV